MQWEEIMRILL